MPSSQNGYLNGTGVSNGSYTARDKRRQPACIHFRSSSSPARTSVTKLAYPLVTIARSRRGAKAPNSGNGSEDVGLRAGGARRPLI